VKVNADIHPTSPRGVPSTPPEHLQGGVCVWACFVTVSQFLYQWVPPPHAAARHTIEIVFIGVTKARMPLTRREYRFGDTPNLSVTSDP